MAVVDAVVWYWTPGGMRQQGSASGTAYIEVREVERLLEEAHARGFRAATEKQER